MRSAPFRPHSAVTSNVTSPVISIDGAAAVRVDRARIELRHGRTIALQRGDGDWLLAASIETLMPAQWQALARLDLPHGLLLTRERQAALGWPDASTPRVHRIAGAAGLEALQSLAAVTPGGGDKHLLTDPEPADAEMLAVLTLAKRARLIPALLVLELPAARAALLDADQVLRLSADDVARVVAAPPTLRRVSDAHVPIAAHEDCTLVLFREVDTDAEHVAIIVGSPALDQPVPVRLHSSCLTGDLLGSLRCDCGDQLRRAIEHLAQAGGVLLYLSQEGRSTGLANKLRAYRLQDGGLDTLAADRHLGFHADERDFQAASAMLQALGIARIRLLTNNPQKIDALRAAGIDVVERVPLIAAVNTHNTRYVQTKRDQAGHLLDDDQE